MRRTDLHLGQHQLEVWVAVTPEELAQGVRALPPLQAGQGLLMYIHPAREISLSMQGVNHALDVAFLSPSRRITALRTLTPEGPEITSPTAVGYALELPAGWLAAHGIGVGSRAEIAEESQWLQPAPPRIGFI